MSQQIAAKKNTEFTKEPVTPCGSCLQVMAEFEAEWNKELDVYLYGENKVFHVKGVKHFLPFLFKSDFLVSKAWFFLRYDFANYALPRPYFE